MPVNKQRSNRKIVPALKETDNRFTSPVFLRAVENSFSDIDLDPCWHPSSAVKAKTCFDIRKGQNGLAKRWRAKVVFVNPPWSAAKKWIEKSYEEWRSGRAKLVVCLVPSKTDTKLFHHFLAKDADVYFVEGRPRFLKEDGTSEQTAQSVMVVIFGATREQSRRFAELVPGSWWLPQQRSLVFKEEVCVSPFNIVSSRNPYSCTAQFSGDMHRAVLCRPVAEAANVMRSWSEWTSF